jgi:hypothetical protein
MMKISATVAILILLILAGFSSCRRSHIPTAYEQKVYKLCKTGFMNFFKKELQLSQVKEVNRQEMSKFASVLNHETISGLPCELKDILVVDPNVTDPSPIAVEIVGTGVWGNDRVMYVPHNQATSCLPGDRGTGWFIQGARDCTEHAIEEGQHGGTDCECDQAICCGCAYHVCSHCPK